MYDIDRDVKPRAAVRHIAFQGTKRSIVSDENHVNYVYYYERQV
jgi:hypothetical protein